MPRLVYVFASFVAAQTSQLDLAPSIFVNQSTTP